MATIAGNIFRGIGKAAKGIGNVAGKFAQSGV